MATREDMRIDDLAGADRFGALPVVHRPNLFTPKRELMPAGMTIEEIVASVDTLPALFLERGVVTIDRRDGNGSEIVPRHMWRYVRPRSDSEIPIEVNLWLAPESKGVRQIVSLVAVIAVIAASIFITGGGLAGLPFIGGLLGAGSFGASIAAAGVPVGPSLSTRALG